MLIIFKFNYTFLFAGEVGRLLRGELLLSKDWARAKLLQSRTESLLKLFEEKKKEIWDFALVNNSIEKVSYFVERSSI